MPGLAEWEGILLCIGGSATMGIAAVSIRCRAAVLRAAIQLRRHRIRWDSVERLGRLPMPATRIAGRDHGDTRPEITVGAAIGDPVDVFRPGLVRR